MDAVIIVLFLVVFPSAIGGCLHFWLVKDPISTGKRFMIFGAYGYGTFWLSLFIKYIRGSEDCTYFESYRSVQSLFRCGTLLCMIAVLVPLLISLCILLYKKIVSTIRESGGGYGTD